MLDAAPLARNAREKRFAESYFRALRNYPDCPLVWKQVAKQSHTSSGARRTSSGCWDWWTNDADAPVGTYVEVYGGGDDSGCEQGFGGGPAVSNSGTPNAPNARTGGGGTGGTTSTNYYPFNAAIASAATDAYGTSDVGRKPPGLSCRVACVYVVNSIVHDATGEYMCGADMMNTDQVKRCSQTALISQGTSRAGDFIIVDALNGHDAHIGICLNTGCTKMNSNGSSDCRFNFTNQNFDYPGSPYTNGYVTYWRMIN